MLEYCNTVTYNQIATCCRLPLRKGVTSLVTNIVVADSAHNEWDIWLDKNKLFLSAYMYEGEYCNREVTLSAPGLHLQVLEKGYCVVCADVTVHLFTKPLPYNHSIDDWDEYEDWLRYDERCKSSILQELDHNPDWDFKNLPMKW